MTYDILEGVYTINGCAKPTSPIMERRRFDMRELLAKTPKQLDICLRLLYAEKVDFHIKVSETEKKKIVYKIGILDNDLQRISELEEKYRILIS